MTIESAVAETPDRMKAAAVSFLNAGANVIVAPTDTPEAAGSSDHSVPRPRRAFCRRAVKLCREAVAARGGGERWVFGAVGPVDALLMLDEVTPKALFAGYWSQALALAEGGADAVICRGFREIEALRIAARAVIEATGLPAIATLRMDAGAAGPETSLSVTVPHACAALADAEATMIGADAGDDPDRAAAIVEAFGDSCDCPIWIGIAAGPPEIRDGAIVHPEAPERFAARIAPLVKAGASVIAGGSGVSAAHVAAMVRAGAKSLSR